jgi:citrate synthase
MFNFLSEMVMVRSRVPEANAGHSIALRGSPNEGEYVSARDAAKMLGVSLQTLYAYVSRKGLRSQPIPGGKRRRYWKPDIERVARGEEVIRPARRLARQESKLTLLTDGALYYRGVDAAELAETSSFESVAALLWGLPESEVFKATPPALPRLFQKMHRLLRHESDVNRAMSMLPLFEEVNPKAYDLSPLGMARTGADVVRVIAAITLGSERPTGEPLHEFIARTVGASALQSELIRRQLVLAADHGFEPGAVAVRVAASAGVSPWRSVITGLAIVLGRRTNLSRWLAVSRLLTEITASADPARPILERIRAGENVPGFDAPMHAHGDPRARALLGFCDSALAKDSSYQRLAEALAAAKSIQGLEPNFPLAFQFVDSKTGIGPHHTLYHVGRSAGWIAHGIEQSQAGETERLEPVYRGNLPA